MSEPIAATEDRLREVIALNPFFGDWDEWRPVYDKLPVQTRAVLSHIHGRHDGHDPELPFAHCVLCYTFRERPHVHGEACLPRGPVGEYECNEGFPIE